MSKIGLIGYCTNLKSLIKGYEKRYDKASKENRDKVESIIKMRIDQLIKDIESVI